MLGLFIVFMSFQAAILLLAIRPVRRFNAAMKRANEELDSLERFRGLA